MSVIEMLDIKKLAPLKWEFNGGALLSGEDIVEGLVREIYEELGIKLERDEAIFLKNVKKKQSFKEIYLFEKDITMNELNFKDGEVADAKWVNIEEFMDMFESGEIVNNVDFDDKDYELCIELLKFKK